MRRYDTHVSLSLSLLAARLMFALHSLDHGDARCSAPELPHAVDSQHARFESLSLIDRVLYRGTGHMPVLML